MSVAIMQVLKFYCNYADGSFCYSYVVDLSVATMQMAVSVVIIHLDVFVALMQAIVSAAYMWVTIFI